MKKELFLQTLEYLRNQWELDQKVSEAFKVINGSYTIPDNQNLWDASISLLEHLMFDEASIIDYYVYELEFGTKPHSKDAVTVDGKKYSLETPEQLWEFLNLT